MWMKEYWIQFFLLTLSFLNISSLGLFDKSSPFSEISLLYISIFYLTFFLLIFQAGGASGMMMDLAANEKAVHADFFNGNWN